MNTGLVMKSGGEALMHPDFFILAAKFVRSGYVNFITKEVSGNLCFTLTQNEVEELIVHI
jgi:3,4-dihydroxy-2-butanone 4-phosphate synthase